MERNNIIGDDPGNVVEDLAGEETLLAEFQKAMTE